MHVAQSCVYICVCVSLNACTMTSHKHFSQHSSFLNCRGLFVFKDRHYIFFPVANDIAVMSFGDPSG